MRFSSMLMKRWLLNYFSIVCLSCLIMNFYLFTAFKHGSRQRYLAAKDKVNEFWYSQFFLSRSMSSVFFCIELLEFIACLDLSPMWIHLLTYLDWIWEFSTGVSPTKYLVSTQAIFSSITKLDSMSNLIKGGYLI